VPAVRLVHGLRPPPAMSSPIEAAQQRGWITLEHLIDLASHSPVDTHEARELARQAGIDLVEGEGDPWEHIERLADEGPGAFRETREGPAAAEELGPGDPATLYLGEISRTRLLTADEEIQLAQERDAAKAARAKLDQGSVSDPAERAQLEEAVRRGEAARRRLIESNLRLVVTVAKKYLGRGLSFLDLVQEGNLGLQKATDRYDWRKGFRFSTYAYWWIRQAVGRAVAEQARTIRLPGHIFELLSKLYSAARELQEELGRPPSAEEIGARVGVEANRVRDAFRAARVPISLDLPVGEDATATLGDLIADAAGPSPSDEAEEAALASSMRQALERHLAPREAEVVRLRFGLDRDGEERTLGEVGAALGVSRERARQLEAEALRKLRHTSGFREQFREFVS
jgi:RNA polymerase primary sigma factor